MLLLLNVRTCGAYALASVTLSLAGRYPARLEGIDTENARVDPDGTYPRRPCPVPVEAFRQQAVYGMRHFGLRRGVRHRHRVGATCRTDSEREGTMKADPVFRQQRVEKWLSRAAEWYRLAGSAEDPQIEEACRRLAHQAESMARFWGRKDKKC
jgi:hypothetical protein